MLNFHYQLSESVCCELGDIRQNNQDAILARRGIIEKHNLGLYVVADGCGGMEHGDQISQMIIAYLDRIWDETLPAFLKQQKATVKVLSEAFLSWIQQINKIAIDCFNQIGTKAGSTVSILVLFDRHYFIINVGDSRVYRRRAKRLQQLTEDQSLVADMLRNSEITPEQAENFERKNVLTMCIGHTQELQCFYTEGKLRRKDLFLLCSDGLHTVLTKDDLIQNLPNRVLEDSAKQLREVIPQGKALDNVSVVLIQVV